MTKEESQFELLFNDHYDPLCKAAYALVRNKSIAEDIVQNVFLRLWQDKRKEAIRDLGSYLYRATINASIDVIRQDKKIIRLTAFDTMKLPATETAEELLTQHELSAAIDNALKKLPPKCRVIFLLSRYEGKKYKEIAELLGLSEKTVENQMGIALEKLRKELRSHVSHSSNTYMATSLLILFIPFTDLLISFNIISLLLPDWA